MWVQIFCGLVIYKLFRRFISGDDTDFSDLDSKDSDVAFAVANRLEKIYGGRAFVGLRIPDRETGSRQHIDVVVVTKREVIVVAIRSFTGFLERDKEGNWVCIRDKKHKPEIHPDPVLEIRRQIAILESYLEQRGVFLPEGQLIGRVVLPNPLCRTAYSIASQSEVISYEKWTDFKPESKFGILNWIKDTFIGGKTQSQDGEYQKIHFALSTSPTWDRLELNSDKNILGEFIEFKGNSEDMVALRNLKRSKVSKFMIQKSTLFGALGRTRIQLMYSPRDYQSEGGSSYDWKDVFVKHYTEVIFQPMNSKKARKFKLSSIASITLSA